MAVELNIDKKLDNNNVQVRIDSNKIQTRFFKVPAQRADEFCSRYKKFDREETIFSYIKVLVPTLACCATGSVLAKNLSKVWKNVVAIGAGILGGSLAIPLNIKDIAKREKRLLNEFNAEQIYYLKNDIK